MPANEEVARPSAEMATLGADWPMLEALMGGTRQMRGAGKLFLPQWPNEENKAYEQRLETATLFPAYRRTVRVMAGKPFSKQATLSDDTPVEIAGRKADPKDPSVTAVPGWADDIDREGTSLHVFAAQMFEESFYGVAGILIDAPRPVAPAATGRPVTRAEQTEAGVRPYFVAVRHGQVLDYVEEVENGQRRAVLVRIKECVTERVGLFGKREVTQIRVLEPGKWSIWRANAQGDWSAVDEGVSGLPDIPFVLLPRRGQHRPPLLDLAFMNVEHWQSKSDQQTILHVARVPILALIGANGKSNLVLGASSAVNVPAGGDLKWVEHSGKAIEAGEKSLERLEDQMIQAGAELLVKRPGTRTATETSNDAEGNKCELQRMAEDFEDAMDLALDFMARLGGLSGGGGSLSLFKDFGADSLSAASAQLIRDLAAAGIISHETAINELKRRGELAPEVDAQDEAEKVAMQGAALGLIPPPGAGA